MNEYFDDEISEDFNGDMEEYQGDKVKCPNCGGEMDWCSGCAIYTQTCCVMYGTCMCS